MHVPLRAPQLRDLLSEINVSRVPELITRAAEDRDYLHWDTLIHLAPPEGRTSREWWFSIKFARLTARRLVPLMDTQGEPFHFSTPDSILRALHQLDQQLAGRIDLPATIVAGAGRDRYVTSSLMEEAITSSQLEGAVTSRRVAKDLLRTGRPPRDKSERMIANNFAAMQRVRALQRTAMTPRLVCELHRLVTLGTLDDPASAGRLEVPGEPRVKIWGDEDQVLHTPPPAEELPGRLQAFCDFANNVDDRAFVHPVLRAVILHFWMGYDHYFADGNGRTARAVFYWSLLHEGYWLAEYLTISSILRRAPVAYAQAFLLTETDDNDLTYFLVEQLDVIGRAVQSLHDYLRRKAAEIRNVETLLRDGNALNHRQRALLGRALRDADSVFTIAGHRSDQGVVYETARSDLLDLADRGFLLRGRRGNAFVFTVPDDLNARLSQPY